MMAQFWPAGPIAQSFQALGTILDEPDDGIPTINFR